MSRIWEGQLLSYNKEYIALQGCKKNTHYIFLYYFSMTPSDLILFMKINLNTLFNCKRWQEWVNTFVTVSMTESFDETHWTGVVIKSPLRVSRECRQKSLFFRHNVGIWAHCSFAQFHAAHRQPPNWHAAANAMNGDEGKTGASVNVTDNVNVWNLSHAELQKASDICMNVRGADFWHNLMQKLCELCFQ